jgi:D-serine deaminase-like pyridoxal phosphate-dependent protein
MIDTPAVLVDLDAVDRNIARMQRHCDDHGLRLRAHVKTHKLRRIAELQIQAGAHGIACQKVGEAETVAPPGADLLVTFPLVGAAKTRRFAELARTGIVSVAADSDIVVRGLAEALQAAGAEAGVLVDCDTGFGRTGVQTPDAAADLAELIDSLPGVRFEGLFTHPAPVDAVGLLSARRAIERRGLHVATVSVGGTAHAFRAHELESVTELRAGTYVYGDRACIANGTTTIDDCALRVAATVVSRPTPARAVLDAGSKTLTSDRAQGCDPETYGLVVEYPSGRLGHLYEEHAVLDLDPSVAGPDVGERVTVIPNHACGVVNLHDVAEIYRGGAHVDSWRIDGRGAVR